jgi:RNA polymerase sigma-70 factor (ECF subfamily)
MGLTAETAAQVLGKRAGAVRTAAHRGLRRLAEKIDQPIAGIDRPTPPAQRGRHREASGEYRSGRFRR